MPKAPECPHNSEQESKRNLGVTCTQILAIDPGPERSAYVLWDGETIWGKSKIANDLLLVFLHDLRLIEEGTTKLAVEQIESFGMAVGREVFTTVWWSGRFIQAWQPGAWKMVPRRIVKIALCRDSRARDSNIRQALIDRFGPPGRKKAPGVTYGLAGDLWQAFALSVYAYDMEVSHG